jgi:hypothetical protein
MGGEAAHLHYKRGIARLAQKYTGAAQEDLKVAVADNTGPVWVRGRAHLELGKIADLAGNRGLARTEYQAAAALCETGNDPGGVEAAKKLIEKPYRQ